MGLVRGKKPRVEYVPGLGWIARRANGEEVWPDFVWASRSVARTVALEADIFDSQRESNRA